MSYCPKCGTELNGEVAFCPKCGSKMYSEKFVIPPEYRPISAWGYFGWTILFAIPVVGIILLIIFVLGGTSNINLKNFARSYFCWVFIALILVVFAFCTGGLSHITYHYAWM